MRCLAGCDILTVSLHCYKRLLAIPLHRQQISCAAQGHPPSELQRRPPSREVSDEIADERSQLDDCADKRREVRFPLEMVILDQFDFIVIARIGLTPIAKKSVRPRLPSHAAVKGSRSFDVMCLRCASGPAMMAKLRQRSRMAGANSQWGSTAVASSLGMHPPEHK